MCFLPKWERYTDTARFNDSGIDCPHPYGNRTSIPNFASFWMDVLQTVNDSVANSSLVHNVSGNGMDESVDGVSVPGARSDDAVVFLLDEVLIPTIAALGMIGNGLNVFILSWRHRRRDIDIMEKSALLGLIALAVSDMAFCTLVVPKTLLPSRTWFTVRGVHLAYQLYGIYLQNVFIKTSTWLTLVVGLARYVGICHPLRARLCIGMAGIRTAILCTYGFWFVAEAPLLWTYDVKEMIVDNTTYYYIDVGAFARNEALQTGFTYAWALIGYLVPVATLIYCNSCLIRALRQSHKLRRQASVRSDSSMRHMRITLTLIVLILMFILLVSPSEIIHFYSSMHVDSSRVHDYKLGIICTNVLQTVNFAFSFVLYCVVNATFRRTVTGWISRLCGAGVRGQQQPQQNQQQIDASEQKPARSSSSGGQRPRAYYCALKHSTTVQSSLLSARSVHGKWNETVM